MRIHVITMLLISLLTIEAKSTDLYLYKYDDIPQKLLNNADAVVRTDQISFEILSIEKAIYKRKLAITILNKDAGEHAYLSLNYNKFFKIIDIIAKVYDKNGVLKKTLFKNDAADVSIIESTQMYSDDRCKILNLSSTDYPYTVEYEYTIKYEGLINIPSFWANSNDRSSVQQKSFQIIKPEGFNLRFTERNLKQKCSIDTIAKNIIYTWDYKNILASKSEAFLPSSLVIEPVVYAAPTEFKFGDYQGKMDTWQEFGKWYATLNQNIDELPENVKTDISNLTKNTSDVHQKAKAIYEYMQNRTRYFNVSIGIGGFKSETAAKVHQSGYGDCKALTNYTKALLKLAGIKAYNTLVLSGENKDIDPSFPSNTFDHVILCIPNANDTIWLECTNQSIPFGYLGSFTCDRNVLIIEENGGKLAHTPRYLGSENSISVSGIIKYLPFNNTKVFLNFNFSGLSSESLGNIKNLSKNEQKEAIYRNLGIQNFTIEGLKIKNGNSSIPKVEMDLNLDILGFGFKTEKRIIFNPKVSIIDKSIPEPDSSRQFDIAINNSKMYSDSIIIEMPVGYIIELIPEQKSIISEFGSYSRQIIQSNNNLIYIRKEIVNKGIYSKSKYQEFRNYFKEILLHDKENIILKKSE